MDLLFVRHGQADPQANAKGGILDPPLSDLGRRQADCIARAAATWHRPDKLFVSPSLRAQQTAEPLCRLWQMQPEVAGWLEEMKTPPDRFWAHAEALQNLRPDLHDRAIEEWPVIPGSEPIALFRQRVAASLCTILGHHDFHADSPTPSNRVWRGGHQRPRLAFIGHGGWFAVAVEFLLGIPPVPWTTFRMGLPHAGVSMLRAIEIGGLWVFGLVRQGNQHLPRELRSH